MTGLAVMGSNLASNLARNGFVTAVHNRSVTKTDALIAEHGSDGAFVPSSSAADFVASLTVPRKVIIMVKAGSATDAVIDELSELMEPGDILIDGGNAQFGDTRRREEALRDKGIHFVGCGISGGEEGALNGPSIMPGGSAESYERLGPILEKISAQVDGQPCATHVGTDGAGHFVKMVHNGIEYADMQLIAEAYDLLRRGAGLTPAEIADVFTSWNTGELESFLVEITAEVLRHNDPDTGLPLVDVIADAAAQKGTGTWTVQTALTLGTPVSGIAEAVFARGLSAQPEQRQAAAAACRARSRAVRCPTGNATWRRPQAPCTPPRSSPTPRASTYRRRRRGVRLENRQRSHGEDLAGRLHYPGGFLNRITEAFEQDPELASLLIAPYFAAALPRRSYC